MRYGPRSNPRVRGGQPRRALILSVPTGNTPFAETVEPYQVELITAALLVANFEVQFRLYHPHRIENDVTAWPSQVVFNMAYGFTSTRDGVYQEQADVAEYLENLGCNCLGSVSSVQRIAQDKLETQKVLASAGILSPEIIDPQSWPDDEVIAVLKPRRGACHRGVRTVTRGEITQLSSEIGSDWLLQRYITGPEYTVAVIEDPDRDDILVFPPIRIKFRDVNTSWPIMSEYRFDWHACVDKKSYSTFKSIARTVFRTMGLRDYARLDFRLSKDGPVLLDANALPGMNPSQGLFALAAFAAGIDYHILISKLARRVLQRIKE